MDLFNPYQKKSFDDIVFENRNKQYGSYLLRQISRRNTLVAVCLITGVVIILLALYLIDFSLLKKQTQPLIITTNQITLAEPPPILETLPPAVPPAAAKLLPDDLSEIDVKKDEEVKDKDKTSSPAVIDSSATGSNTGGNNPNSQVTGNGKTIYQSAEVQPEYPGGTKGLKRYLSDNLKYPDIAKENGITGTVNVVFVVNEDGSVSDVKVENSIGGGCDLEAMRIVKEMRRWKPAKQGGEPVAVYMRLPISFQLQE